MAGRAHCCPVPRTPVHPREADARANHWWGGTFATNEIVFLPRGVFNSVDSRREHFDAIRSNLPRR
eukprot:6699371-Prymnesium_polylepis.2